MESCCRFHGRGHGRGKGVNICGISGVGRQHMCGVLTERMLKRRQMATGWPRLSTNHFPGVLFGLFGSRLPTAIYHLPEHFPFRVVLFNDDLLDLPRLLGKPGGARRFGDSRFKAWEKKVFYVQWHLHEWPVKWYMSLLVTGDGGFTKETYWLLSFNH